MSANAFRSPLMQQFAAAARGQHRPPLALSSHLSSSNNNKHEQHRNHHHEDILNSTRSIGTKVVRENGNAVHRPLHNSTKKSITPCHRHLAVSSPSSSPQRRLQMKSNSTGTASVPSSAACNDIEKEDEREHRKYAISASASTSTVLVQAPFQFQDMIQSRRTTSAYNPVQQETIPRIRDAIARAIQCATKAPNHHRTEPTTYYRILHSSGSGLGEVPGARTSTCSSATHRNLMNICYNVALWKNLKGGKKSLKEAMKSAETKRDKWRDTIGGYIVVSVGSQPVQDDHCEEYENQCENEALFFEMIGDEDASRLLEEPQEYNRIRDIFQYWYETMPVRAPQTERQLEDYASACASIQNILLSLHSESETFSISSDVGVDLSSDDNQSIGLNIGTKWATGPMIRCRAMRKLIGCKSDDALVGLVMVGDRKIMGKTGMIQKDWRRRREFIGDVLRDL